jgi:hypothetical protein
MSLLEQLFPGLRATPYLVMSPRTRRYNCIAWAAGDDANWWWPTNGPGDAPRFWPAGAPREETLAAFIAAFATLNFTPTDSAVQESGFEKVAVFVDTRGVPTHAARQLPTGLWTSKLGQWEDIEHQLLALEGEIYGRVAVVFKRPNRAAAAEKR